MGLGVLPGRELELVCQLVKRGVGGGQNSRAFPGQAISKFPSHELSTQVDGFVNLIREIGLVHITGEGEHRGYPSS